MEKQVALIVLDGFGLRKEENGNAVTLANTPNYDSLIKKYPHTTLKAHGEAVGLFKGQMGNSEVGHLNLGAGRIVKQDSKKISDLIKEGSFFKNEVLKNAFKKAGDLHIMGLLSDGGVHSAMEHLYALLEMAKRENKQNVYLHLFTDGRDSSQAASISFVKKVQEQINQVGIGKIVSLIGRFYAMDRDKKYDRIMLAYNMLVYGKAHYYEEDVLTALKNSHKRGVTDEFLEPTIILQNKKAVTVKEGDSVIFFNYRGDRARELSYAFTEPKFNEFPVKQFKDLYYVGFTQYDASLNNVKVAFLRQNMNNTLGEVLSKNNKTQLRIAETTKYAHVTYFFNGGNETPNKKEDRILINTKDVKTFDLLPEMSAMEIAEKVVEVVKNNNYDFVLINFANCDMVGHTGNLEASIKAVETVDKALGIVVEHFKKLHMSIFVTADHGNAETMVTKEGLPQTAHTLNPVPFILVDDTLVDKKLKRGGKLSDVTATVLDVMGISFPEEFEAVTLLKK